MKMRNQQQANTSYVFLNGGLGNQMFGLAAALFAARRVVVLAGASIVKSRDDGKPELFNFTIGENVNFKVLNRFCRPTSKKLHNYLLVAGLNSRSHILFRYSSTIESVVQRLLWCFSRSLFLVVSDDIGYTELPKNGSKFLIGYFQSFRWLEDSKVRSKMHQLFEDIDRKIVSLIDLAKKMEPLIVHVRLGDYRDNEEIGVLSKDYFSQALDIALKSHPNKDIWVFSDEPTRARQMIPWAVENQCRWISEEFELNAEETLALMRHGRNFIISNSTFSWWAAALSEFPDAQVFYPDPWFANGQTPRDLIPRNWSPISRFLDSEENRPKR